MNWDTLKLIWTRLTEQLGFHRVRSDEYRDGHIKRGDLDERSGDRWAIDALSP